MENKKIRFTNGNRSPMSIGGDPEWQTAIIKRVKEDYSKDAIEVSDAFEKAVSEIKCQQGYYGTAIMSLMRKTPRYAYIKNIQGDFGQKYEAEIDLLGHMVTFYEVNYDD